MSRRILSGFRHLSEGRLLRRNRILRHHTTRDRLRFHLAKVSAPVPRALRTEPAWIRLGARALDLQIREAKRGIPSRDYDPRVPDWLRMVLFPATIPRPRVRVTVHNVAVEFREGDPEGHSRFHTARAHLRDTGKELPMSQIDGSDAYSATHTIDEWDRILMRLYHRGPIS